MAPTRTQSKTVTIGVYDPVSSVGGSSSELKSHAAKDASNWNSLLRWHRRNRGPQWDYSTAMYHVDQGSQEYYAGVVPARENVKAEEEKAPASPERPTTRSSVQTQVTPQVPTNALRTSQTPSLPTPQVPTMSLPPMPLPQSNQQQQQSAYPPEARAQYEAMLQRTRQQQGSPPQLQQQQFQPAPGYSPPPQQGYYPGQNVAPQMMFRQQQQQR